MEIEKQYCDQIDTFAVYLCSVLSNEQSCKNLELNKDRHFPIPVLNEDRHFPIPVLNEDRQFQISVLNEDQQIS